MRCGLNDCPKFLKFANSLGEDGVSVIVTEPPENVSHIPEFRVDNGSSERETREIVGGFLVLGGAEVDVFGVGRRQASSISSAS